MDEGVKKGIVDKEILGLLVGGKREREREKEREYHTISFSMQ